jgi:uncharacterized membrane-anchored protein YjiN (DUF445 family)
MTDAERRRDLRRMRILATGLLALMTAVFVATRWAPAQWTWTGYVAAFAEAGMVGACADWFAVTALFRRPLGLPIPHTGIIPRNKDRIGEALGDFIAGNFLTPGVLDRRLKRAEPARRLADWLAAGDHIDILATRVADLLPDMFGSSEQLDALLAEIARRAGSSRPLAPLASRILGWLWREPAVQRLFNRAVETLAGYMAEHEDFIQAQVAGAAWRWLPKWLDRMLAEKFTGGLVGAVQGLGDPNHPWRADLGQAVEDFITRLAEDPDYLAKGEAIKERFLSDPALPRRLGAFWDEIGRRLGADPAARRAIVAEGLGRALRALGQWLAEDPLARDRLDRWIRVVARRTLSSQRHAIGGFVAQVVAGWDAAEVTDRLELQVGRDLQYIRINGTLVGGLVGLTIFSLSRWLS